MESMNTMKAMKNIKPAYATKLGIGRFLASDVWDECPNCGGDNVYFDANSGCYECPDCGWTSDPEY